MMIFLIFRETKKLFAEIFKSKATQIREVRARMSAGQRITASRFARGNASIQQGRYVIESGLKSARYGRMRHVWNRKGM